MEFNDVRLQYEALRDEIDSAIGQVLIGGRYILGPSMLAFEDEFARYCRAAIGIAVASGMDALSIALEALGIRPGDEVLVPAVSAAATAMAVTSVKAKPIFVDISPGDFNIDPAQALDRKTSRTRAVVPVHLYGMPARLKEIVEAGVPVLEDAGQAHGSDARWGRCGSFGVAAAFSFYPTKNLGAYGDAGMIVTSDAAIAERSRLLRNYGQREHLSSEILGRNSRLDELHAAVLRVKLRTLDQWNRRRREIARIYRKALGELPLGMQAETGESNYHLFVITTAERDKLRAHLASRGIPALVHYPIPLHRQKAFREFSPEPCPHADLLCSRVLSLPIHAFLSNGEAERVIDGVRSFFGR
ncbi:MAG: erythromycin biosynthesis sensory transduction protein eryC1 [Acidobacteria bacterium]|nr:MAG: erythromycin biosynthesis sensory transduction protein eryC1 [Acidobacteriota bacterium]